MKYQQRSFSVAYMGKAYRDSWERMFGKKEGPPMREWNGAKMRIRMTYHGTATHSFHVDLVDGEWPEDSDLITLCDGDTPPHSRHFGGRVAKSADRRSAEVDVYVD
jgi:hypothetical protein